MSRSDGIISVEEMIDLHIATERAELAEAECDKLRAQVARMDRELVDQRSLMMRAEEWERRALAADAENARLREALEQLPRWIRDEKIDSYGRVGDSFNDGIEMAAVVAEREVK